ncbi:hypothetical protein ACFOU2_21640 [Bacillus songklensis]|uniref:Uncharacterized protein n=2 Tax=Bacillus songklensis TaxID=1069116 RepID=A0ABV8B9D1_9BACI
MLKKGLFMSLGAIIFHVCRALFQQMDIPPAVLDCYRVVTFLILPAGLLALWVYVTRRDKQKSHLSSHND